jgi:hypothetical protein
MKNCFDLKSKVLFVAARFPPNVLWLWRMKSECYMWFHLAAVRGKKWTKKSFRFKSKVHFFSAQFRPNFTGCGA